MIFVISKVGDRADNERIGNEYRANKEVSDVNVKGSDKRRKR